MAPAQRRSVQALPRARGASFFGLAALLMFRFVRLALGKSETVSARGELKGPAQ